MENENVRIKDNSQLRRNARAQLKGNWGTAIMLCAIYYIVVGITGLIPDGGKVIPFLISGPFMLGLVSCFMHIARSEPFKFEEIFDGFKVFIPAFLLQLFITLFTFLWSLLLIVPGIIAALSYGMSFYILNDNPGMSAIDTLRASKQMMEGYKAKLFGMQLVFVGLSILSIFTLFIGMIWLIPYMHVSLVNFYQNLKENQHI